MVTLSGLYIYPIKSASGIAVSSASITDRGLEYDRRWMLVDANGKFVTQRTHPQLALVSVAIGDTDLLVTAPGYGSQAVPLQPSDPSLISVEVWGDRCDAVPMPSQISQWFSEVLRFSCRLVYMPDQSDRPVDHGKVSGLDSADGLPQVSFADAYPFLLISEASLADLNHRLDTPVPMNRFRPNLVVRGCRPFAEDGWGRIRMGAVAFRVAKPCSRCTITTVDQGTGQRGVEPLKTLATFRQQQGQIMFGQNLVQEELGTLHVGDAVEASS